MAELKNAALWRSFATQEALTDAQIVQFEQYYRLLVDYNTRVNLTRITDEEDVISYHFRDSLALGHAVDMTGVTSLADVGSGAGFPGIPLKIKYPQLKVFLIDSSGKRIQFLKTVIQELGLEGVETIQTDWRTFVRKTHMPIDYFVARASLSIAELTRLFKPASAYHNTQLVYWASDVWECSPEHKALLQKEYEYMVGHKKRHLVFFKRS